MGAKIFYKSMIEVIPPRTLVNSYETYDIVLKTKELADILLSFHEPKYACVETIA